MAVQEVHLLRVILFRDENDMLLRSATHWLASFLKLT